MSEKGEKEDLMILLARMENEWQELKKLLRFRQTDQGDSKRPDLQVLPQKLSKEEEMPVLDEIPAGQADPKSQSEINKLRLMYTVTPMEAETILHRFEKGQRDVEVLDRLAKLEKQSRRITIIGSMFFTLLALALVIFAFLTTQPYLWGKTNLLGMAQHITNIQSADSGKTEQKVASESTEAESPVNYVKYVGSKTSNKYHYPDCKWAKTILPERLVTFKSVEEAKGKGYIPCPVCNPPASD